VVFVTVMRAFELEELVVAAVLGIRIAAAHVWSRVVNGAPA
jgi:hypothetical protein